MRIAIQNMLLIEDPSILVVRNAMTKIASWFVLPSFAIALAWEYFNGFNFFEVVKKLILILIFIGAFYSIHKEGVDLSLKYSDEILREISPRNVFLRKWGEVKIKTTEEKTSQKTGWNVVENFVVPNLNDLIGTAIFLMSKLAIWILKLVYSTVYHLTYIFAPLTAVLYFFPITRGSLSGSIFSSIWCMILPFVLVAILALVGNSMQASANQGELIFSSMDQILWLFGVTLLIASTPIITLGLLKGGGMAMSGSAVGALMSNSATKFFSALPGASRHISRAGDLALNTGRMGANKFSNGFKKGNSELSNTSKQGSNTSKNDLDGMRPVGENYNQNSSSGYSQPQNNESSNSLSSQFRPNSKASHELPSVTNSSGFNSQRQNGIREGGAKLAKGFSRILTMKENKNIGRESSSRFFVNTQKVQKQTGSSLRNAFTGSTKNIQQTPIKESVTKNLTSPQKNNWSKKTQRRDNSNFRREL